MKLWQSIKHAAARKISNWLQSYHESVEQSPLRGNLGRWWSNRAPDPNEAGDARSRQESIRLSQWLENNDAFAFRLGTLFVQYTVGAGMRIKAASSDPEWNAINQGKWDLWCKMPDRASVQDFDSFQSMCAWRTFFDGAGYIIKTHSGAAPYYPRLQFVEAMNVQTPPSLADRKNIFDGKETDERGRIVRYHIRQIVNGEESFKAYEARDIIPICDFNRPGELHTFPYLDPVLNKLRDLRELRLLAMDKAKESAETKNVFKTQNRELPEAEQIRQGRLSVAKTLADGTEITKQKLQMMDDKLGGKNIAIGIDEDVSQLASMSPNEIDQAHYRILSSEICAGANIPMMLVFPESVQGTVGRAVLDDFAIWCKGQSKVFKSAFEDVYRWVTSEHIKIDAALADFPRSFDWWKCSIRPPRAPNVDVGRDMNARIGALEVGGATLDDFYLPQGMDTEEQIERGFQILAKINECAERYKVPIGQFRASLSEARKMEIEEEQLAQGKDDADVPTKPAKALLAA